MHALWLQLTSRPYQSTSFVQLPYLYLRILILFLNIGLALKENIFTTWKIYSNIFVVTETNKVVGINLRVVENKLKGSRKNNCNIKLCTLILIFTRDFYSRSNKSVYLSFIFKCQRFRADTVLFKNKLVSLR